MGDERVMVGGGGEVGRCGVKTQNEDLMLG